MALRMIIETDFGVPAEYWNIGGYGEDYKGGGSEVILYGWANKQARMDNKQPLAIRKIQFTGPNYTPDMKRPALYARVKQNEGFVRSEDDLTANADISF